MWFRFLTRTAATASTSWRTAASSTRRSGGAHRRTSLLVAARSSALLLGLLMVMPSEYLLSSCEATSASSSSTIQLRLYLVRHGESAANKWSLLAGQEDFPLSDTGMVQAQVLGRTAPWLLPSTTTTFWRFYSSDLIRARDTMTYMLQAAAAQHNSDFLKGRELLLDTRLRERSYGARQGMSRSLSEEDALKIWQSHGMPPPPYETDEQVWNRTLEWLLDVVAELRQDRQANGDSTSNTTTNTDDNGNTVITYHVLVTAHAGVIRELLRHLFTLQELQEAGAQFETNRPQRLVIPNTSVSIVEFNIPLNDEDGGDEDEEDDVDANSFLDTARIIDLTNAEHLEQVQIHDD